MLRPSPDHALVGAAQEGDPNALDLVLRYSRQDLRRYAERHCGINDVEDAVQETLFVAAQRIGDLRSLQSFNSWLFRIIKRECYRLQRGWRLLTNQEIDEKMLPVITPEPGEWRIDVGRVLAALPAHYRSILLLRDIEGLPLELLAERLGLSLAATKSRLHRARQLARDLLMAPG